MLRPHWDKAPEWAQWMAMDGDGEWFWYDNKPIFLTTWQPNCWARPDRSSRMEFAGHDISGEGEKRQAQNSLQQRPFAKPKWCDAPPWAQWLAMDMCGVWYWYETEPSYEGPVWMAGDGEVLRASEGSKMTPGCSESLEQRP